MAVWLNVSPALARLQAGEEVDVEALVDRFLANHLANTGAAALLVSGLRALGHPEQSERVYQAAMRCRRTMIERNPESTEAAQQLVRLAALYGRDLDEALKMAQDMVEKDPRNSEFLASLSLVHYVRGEPERGREAYLRAVRWNPYFIRYSRLQPVFVSRALHGETGARD